MRNFLTTLVDLNEDELRNLKYVQDHEGDSLPKYNDQLLFEFRALIEKFKRISVRDLGLAKSNFFNKPTAENRNHVYTYDLIVADCDSALSRIKYKGFGRDFSKEGKILIPICDLLENPIRKFAEPQKEIQKKKKELVKN